MACWFGFGPDFPYGGWRFESNPARPEGWGVFTREGLVSVAWQRGHLLGLIPPVTGAPGTGPERVHLTPMGVVIGHIERHDAHGTKTAQDPTRTIKITEQNGRILAVEPVPDPAPLGTPASPVLPGTGPARTELVPTAVGFYTGTAAIHSQKWHQALERHGFKPLYHTLALQQVADGTAPRGGVLVVTGRAGTQAAVLYLRPGDQRGQVYITGGFSDDSRTVTVRLDPATGQVQDWGGWSDEADLDGGMSYFRPGTPRR